jgi:hypothetical protein
MEILPGLIGNLTMFAIVLIGIVAAILTLFIPFFIYRIRNEVILIRQILEQQDVIE